jgi:hypothetical protein
MDCCTEKVGGTAVCPALTGVLILVLCLLQQSAAAAGNDTASEPKMVSGISIVGNDEAPKSLFIVPWKSSEIGFETGLTSGMMDDSMRPVDKDVFMREIDFYEIRHEN